MRRRPRRRPPARCLGPSRLLASILVCARGKRLPYLGGVRPPRQSSFSSSTCTDLQGVDRALRDSPGAARRLSPVFAAFMCRISEESSVLRRLVGALSQPVRVAPPPGQGFPPGRAVPPEETGSRPS